MRSRDISNWMWGEALAMLERAERLQRQFFQHATVAWEPPVDIIETAEHVQVHVALPGVAADSITVAADPAGISISAARSFPCSGDTLNVHRIEIPYGRFERQVALPLGDPYAPLELVEKRLADGVLTLIFKKKEGA
ncbi:MAG TPA: Hsp20/alpha crystallin family protein [Burkholderiales bacterium]|nr:Hsp20/alpha crystallin family protein [Burkholderiales bacterium]